MDKLLQQIQIINHSDLRQKNKIKHLLSDIITLAFFAMAANANDCVEIQAFEQEHKQQLKQLIPLKNGVPSHDTINRAFSMISPQCLQDLQTHFNQLLNSGEGEKVRKILSIDGKTQCGNGNKDHKANHIVSVVDNKGFCLGQELVDEKSNEITAIPRLLYNLNVKGNIITTDAMGTQKDIVTQIRQKRADYVLALKRNQGGLFLDVSLVFVDPKFLANCAYHKTAQRARGDF